MTDSILAPGAGVASASAEMSASEGATPAPSLPARRRQWSDEEKARIVSESFEPGSSVGAVARRHGVSDTTLTKWRRRAREGALPGARIDGSAPPFVPVVVDSVTSEQTVAIEALGVVVRLPVESAVDRIVAVASGLGRASS